MCAFLVEPGSGVAGANAYITVAEYREYWTDRGVDYTSKTDAEIQAEIIKGSAGLDGRYGSCYRGTRASYTQGLLWPRTDATYDDDTAITGVPTEIKHATAEFAVRSAGTESVLPDRDPLGVIKEKTEQVDVVKRTLKYAGPGEQLNQSTDPYQQVTAILRDILISCSSSSVAAPIVGGLTYTDLDANKTNPDTYQPSFERGMFDNETSVFSNDRWDC